MLNTQVEETLRAKRNSTVVYHTHRKISLHMISHPLNLLRAYCTSRCFLGVNVWLMSHSLHASLQSVQEYLWSNLLFLCFFFFLLFFLISWVFFFLLSDRNVDLIASAVHYRWQYHAPVFRYSVATRGLYRCIIFIEHKYYQLSKVWPHKIRNKA